MGIYECRVHRTGPQNVFQIYHTHVKQTTSNTSNSLNSELGKYPLVISERRNGIVKQWFNVLRKYENNGRAP